MKSKSLFWTFGIVAAILPAIVWGAISPTGFNVVGRADETIPLKLWIEPNVVATTVGKTVEVEVWGLYDTKSMIIPKVEFELASDEGIEVANKVIIYNKSFMGQVILDKVSIKALRPGTYQVRVVENTVNTGLPSLPVETGDLKVIVK